jgi:CTP synthase
MLEQNVHTLIAERLGLCGIDAEPASASVEKNAFHRQWRDMALSIDDSRNTPATVALVGKYTTQLDSYLSVISALKHACYGTRQRLNLIMVESSNLEEPGSPGAEGEFSETKYRTAWEAVKGADAILVPGGFGIRGIEGKVAAVRFARENRVPFLGVCLGMQAAVIEYTRSVLKRPLANSREFAPQCADADAAIIFMPEGDREVYGGTMRLGTRRTALAAGSLASKIYGDAKVADERHRHRYEVNPELVAKLEEHGLRFSGKDETQLRMEVTELPISEHPYFIGTQYHPEFKSRPLRPAPVFLGLLQAAKSYREQKAIDSRNFRTSNLQQ